VFAMSDLIHRFGDFALDEAARSVTFRGKPIDLQPRVFELLSYLVRHAGRVVPKEELMDALWPDVHVSEASLQRAVSLARRALAVGGMEGAIRNYVRLGYRFAVDEPRLLLLETAQPPTSSALTEARQKAETREWAEASDLFALAARNQELGGNDLDLWAFCLECDRRAPEAGHVLALAVERHIAQGRADCAAKSATVLAKIHLERASIAVAKAWIDRAASLLPPTQTCEAKPLLFWMRSRLASFEGFPEEALELGAEAFLEAEACGIDGLKALSLAYMGFYNIALGRMEEGAKQQDLAAAIALSGKADAVTGALIYCNILWTCRNVADWSRARQWSAGFETWCSASFAESSGTCDLHRAEINCVHNDLPAAIESIDGAIAKLDEEEGWELGEGYRIRGDIHAMIGNFDEARADYAKAYQVGWDAEPGNAILLAEEGDVDGALAALDRTLSGTTWFHLQRSLWIKANKACIAARSGREDLARETLHDIGIEIGNGARGMPAIHAMLAEAQANLQGQDEQGKTQLLLLARQLWTAAGFEFHEARLRVEIAERLHANGDSHGAQFELDAAHHIADKIRSARLLRMVEQALFDLQEGD
jgi:DNA-binding winged helix-turn-helix (wHTH) protein